MPRKHIVRQGEGLSRLADLYGFSPEAIWEDPANAALKELRQDGNILLPGDEVSIPDQQPKSVSVPTGALHRFRRQGIPPKLRLQILKNRRPRKDLPYRLEVEGQVLTGTTDSDGALEVFVPPRAEKGTLSLGDDPPVTLRLGFLDPASERVGVQKRLRNLGLYRGPCNGAEDPRLPPAIAAFQERCGLPATGTLDETTRERLVAVHDRKEAFPQDQESAPPDSPAGGAP